MCRKVMAGGLLLVVCLGFMTVKGVTQSNTTRLIRDGRAEPVLTSGSFARGDILPGVPAKNSSLNELLQALEQVKAQEKVLVERIAQKIQEQRQELNKAEQQFQRISGSRLMPAEGRLVPSVSVPAAPAPSVSE